MNDTSHDGGKRHRTLDFRQQRPDQREALVGKYLADLTKPDFDVAARDLHKCLGRTGAQLKFRLQVLRDTKLREDFRHVNAALSAECRIGKRDRARRQAWPL